MYNFCTLFDSNYLSRGLALYDSLSRFCADFHLYIFAFDDVSCDFLKKKNLKKTTIISLKDFEDPELLKVKPTRNVAEYCWTSTSSVILYVLNNFGVDSCVYLDADLYFFSSPEAVFDEIGDRSIAITEHRFSPRYKSYEANGIYNVQFMFFRKDSDGLAALNWWRDRCLEWCFETPEDGKFGDQKYLDDWTTRFNNVCVIQNVGAGAAPWNIEQYDFSTDNGDIYLTDGVLNRKDKLIFYHFHTFKLYKEGVAKAIGYPLSKNIIERMYKPYLAKLVELGDKVKSEYNDIDPHLLGNLKESKGEVEEALKRMSRNDYDGDNYIIFDNKKYSEYNKKIPFIKKIKKIAKKILNKR